MATVTTLDRDYWARHYAANHSDVDDGVDVIYHLPDLADDREIRLLEVNREIPRLTELNPIRFGISLDGSLDHSINVLDVTPAQWELIRTKQLPLTSGWSLDHSRRLDRDS